MPIINITPPNYKIKDNIQEQVNKHNIDKNAHEGLSLPANGGNADTVDGKHAADLQNYNNLTNKPISMKNPYSLTVQFNGTSQKIYDGSAAHTLNITPSGIGAAAGSHTHANEFFNNNGNLGTPYIDTNKYPRLSDVDKSCCLYIYNGTSTCSDAPHSGSGYCLTITGNGNRKQLYFDFASASVYQRYKVSSGSYEAWTKINDGGNADTVDSYHAYQFQNCDKNGNPENTYLKSAYDESKGKFYIKSYLSSGQNGVGVYVDYAANSDRLQDRNASDFYSVHTYSAERKTNPITWDNGVYTVETDVKKSDGYPFDSGWVHATIYVSGQRNTDPNTGERRGYGVIRYIDTDNNEFIKTQMWGENQWSEWRRIITDDVLSYKETEPNYIGGGYTVMLKE